MPCKNSCDIIYDGDNDQFNLNVSVCCNILLKKELNLMSSKNFDFLLGFIHYMKHMYYNILKTWRCKKNPYKMMIKKQNKQPD